MTSEKSLGSQQIDNSIIYMLIVFFIVLIWSAIKPFSLITWLLEALPAIIMVFVLALTYKHFKFSVFVYFIVLIHTIILLIGSKYTYERNPLFDWFMENYDLNRNYFDRVGHFFQGLTPGFMAKELFIRKGYVKSNNKMFYFIVYCVVLAISAAYELIEFAASRISGVPGYVVLSYQGDEWDTHWDMIMALVGCTTALAGFSSIHNKYMEKIKKPPTA